MPDDNLNSSSEYLWRKDGIITLTGELCLDEYGPRSAITATATALANITAAARIHHKLTLLITSPGGQVEAGVAFIRAIQTAQRQHNCTVTGEVRGMAASAAFFILQACDTRVMGMLDLLMAHGVTYGTRGDLKDTKAERVVQDFYQREFAQFLAYKCYRVPTSPCNELQYWTALLEENTPRYFTADEAKTLGLIDEIV